MILKPPTTGLKANYVAYILRKIVFTIVTYKNRRLHKYRGFATLGVLGGGLGRLWAESALTLQCQKLNSLLTRTIIIDLLYYSITTQYGIYGKQ